MALRRASIVVADPGTERRRAIVDALRAAGLSAVGASHQAEAERLAVLHRPALAIVDTALPPAGGLTAVRALQRSMTVPFILLNRDTEPESRIACLAAGAEDVVDQPADPAEVAVRARRALRRLASADSADNLPRDGDLRLDESGAAVWVGDQRVPLTPDQSVLLRAFLEFPGRVFSRAELAARLRAQSSSTVRDDAIDSQVRALRRRIEPDPAHPRYLLSVRGFGYRLAPEKERPPQDHRAEVVRLAFRTVPTPLVLVDAERRVVLLNQQAESLAGRSGESVEGAQTCAALFRCRALDGRPLTGRSCPGLAALRGKEAAAIPVDIETPRGRQPCVATHHAFRVGEQAFILMTFEPTKHAS